MDIPPARLTQRIRQPSARLRQSPDPPVRQNRKLLPSLVPNYPQFPPENVTLHPDDANNKVLTAIARALLSVDNRAMTIKDLTEMAPQFGLLCQNPSATSQAITTYIRTHLQRCDVQQDQPLLLRHVLSGTPADDDLLPALYSTSGGAHVLDKHKSKDDPSRATNFRKGTMVWYLSRVTGAPCPFSRAGIRLCDYQESNREPVLGTSRKNKVRGQKERESKRLAAKTEDEQCGRKRKRSPSTCNAYDSSDDQSSDEEQPPPTRIKLTLKLRPLARTLTDPQEHEVLSQHSEDDGSSSSDEDDGQPHDREGEHEPVFPPSYVLPPYPRRSISIPTYTPSVDFQSCSSYPTCYTYRRSPSIPYSVASAPPDSGDELDDYHVASFPDMDCDDDSSDIDAMSSSPRSPSAPLLPLMAPSSSALYASEPRVKEEPTDVQGILDTWEGLDHFRDVEYGKPIPVPDLIDIKGEESAETWNWQSDSPFVSSLPPIKSEDVDTRLDGLDLSFDWRSPDTFPSPLLSPISAVSPTSLFTSSPESPVVANSSSIFNDRNETCPTIRPRAKTFPLLPALDTFLQDAPPSTSPPLVTATSNSAFPHSLTALIESLSVSIDTPSNATSEFPPACVSPKQMDIRAWGGEVIAEDSVIVRTCQPCEADLQATQIEGISVYQLKLGRYVVLRRIDTDFVNLSPILTFSDSPSPVITTIPGAVLISKGTELVQGMWVPLTAAQAFLRDHPLSSSEGKGLELFLSNSLVEQFPSALREFVASVKRKGLNGQFGKAFGSMVQAGEVVGQVQAASRLEHPLTTASLPPVISAVDPVPTPDVPLSATEQEIFQALLVSSEWDKENVGASLICSPTPTRSVSKPLTVITTSNKCSKDLIDMDDEPLTPIESSPCSARSFSTEQSSFGRPLRRSKRVQDAAAAKSRMKTKSRSSKKLSSS